MEPDALPLAYLLSISESSLDNFALRKMGEAMELEREIREKEKELLAMRLEAQRLRTTAASAQWIGRHRKELVPVPEQPHTQVMMEFPPLKPSKVA